MNNNKLNSNNNADFSVTAAQEQIKFLTTKDVQELTGLSKKTVDKLFRDPEFPSCNYGKQQFVELNAFVAYFSVPRRKEDSFFWQNSD